MRLKASRPLWSPQVKTSMRFFKELLKQAMVIYAQLGVYFYIYTGTKMEIPHCELEQYHYNALKDWRYGLEGMMDCLRE